jgi:hypothetical protein
MDDAAQKLESAAGEMLREAAQRYGAAATEYGKLLSAYGRGDSDVADLSKAWLNFSAAQAQGAAESAFRWSVEYYKWALGMVGVKLLAPRMAAAEAQATAGRAKR